MSKTAWSEDIANAPHDRLLLLITKPQMLDAATEHIYDILVGYWHEKFRVFVPADSMAAPANGQTLRVHKWAELPDHSDVTVRSQVGLSDAQR
jgi:hypothetical protein